VTETERQQPRLPVNSRVFIELEAPAAGSSEDANIAICRTLDVSRLGIKVALEQRLPVGAYLQIGVEPLADNGDTFFLAAQVRWCRPGDDGENPWLAGFELLPAEHSDLARWMALIGDIS
jgi:PilZ domain-containing protein